MAAPTPLFSVHTDLSDDSTAVVRTLYYLGDAASLGHERLEAIGGKIANFYLPNDSALSLLGGGWALNQTTLKPDPFGSYEYENLPGFHEVQWDPVGLVNRRIADPHEAMAMVNASWSMAVGTISVPSGSAGTGSDTNINMDGPGMHFDEEHEAVFKWRFAKTWVFYPKLWDELNLCGTKAP